MARPATDPGFCPTCRAALGAAARFCDQCGTPAPAERSPQQGGSASLTERRQLAILFYDMVGSSAFAAEMEPEDFADLLGAFHRHVGAVIAAYSGHTARYLGDGGMIYFGFPRAAETDAERAVCAGLEIIASLPALSIAAGRPIHARVGIAAGMALAGDVLGMGPDVAGAAPNLAARLQGLAGQDTLLIDDALHRLVSPLFDCRPLGAHRVYGWAEPVRLWQVIGRATYESRFQARTRTGRSPLVGRDVERADLSAAWHAARAGRGRAVLLRGEAGIGKSRLIAQLLEDAEPAPHRRYCLQCSPHQQGTPFQPCIEMLERLCDFTPEDDAARRRVKLATRLAGAPPDDVALIGHLLMLPMPGAGAALSQMSPPRVRQRTLAALMDGLGRAAAGQPLLMVLEDAHWADPSTLELVERMAGRVGAGPMLLVVSARPAFAKGWDAFRGAEVMDLEPLTAACSAALARHALALAGAPPGEVVAAIVARCDGNPLFIEEVARTVAEAAGGPARPVPASLQASLQERLDLLGPARETARVAAVIGRIFDRALLAAVGNASPGALDEALRRLLDSGLVQQDAAPATPGGEHDAGHFRFKHALIQDAAYDSMTRARRRDLHARTAEAMAALRPAFASAHPELLAHHYTEAADPVRATQWWLRAARQSLQRSAAAEAAAQMERALRLAPALPRGDIRTGTELEMQVLLGKALMATLGQSSTRTGAAFARARALCNAAPETPHFLSALFGQWTYTFMQGALRRAMAQAAEISALADARDDPAWRVVGHYTNGYTQFAMGQFNVARERLEAGIALFDPTEPERYTGVILGNPRVLMRIYLSWALMFLGRIDEARGVVEMALEEARALGPVWTQVYALFQHGTFAMETGEPRLAIERWQEARRIADEFGFPLWEGVLATQMGWATGLCGDTAAGLALIRQGVAHYTATESQLYVPAFARQEAELHLLADDAGRAAERLDAARALARSRDELWDAASMAMLEGRIAAARGEPATAARAFRAAIAIARAQGAVLLEGRARSLLATLGRDAGDGVVVGAPAAAFPRA